jgi:hypothetical protein
MILFLKNPKLVKEPGVETPGLTKTIHCHGRKSFYFFVTTLSILWFFVRLLVLGQ